MAHVFTPLTLRSVTFRNRLAVSPMCQYSAEQGLANDWHLVHLGSRAVGGAALVVAEATAVAPDGRISPADLGLWNDEQIEPLRRITDFISGQGAVPGIQLAHAGRKSSTEVSWKGGHDLLPGQGGWQTVAPSALAFKEGARVPLALDVHAIQRIVADFKQAAARACKAGFRVLELHAAHGYLLHAFLSPLSNQRTDCYGGNFNNRCRLLLEVVDAVRSTWPLALPLFVRISATDWVDGGWQLNESIELAKLLKARDVDLIDCSTGGNVSGVKIPLQPLYQTPFAEEIRKQAGMATAAVGLITTPEEAESVIAGGRADLVFMARELLRDPYFPLHAAQTLGVDLAWPVQYERAKKAK